MRSTLAQKMLTDSIRPLSAAEKRLYQRYSKLPEFGSAPWMQNEKKKAAVTIGVAAALAFVEFQIEWILFPGAITIVWLAVRIARYFERRSMRNHVLEDRLRIKKDANTGSIRSIHCKPIRSFQREEFEDEGEYLIFEGGDGHYLALVGQDFYETAFFPSDHFEILLGARSSSLFSIRNHGSKLTELTTIHGEELPWDTFPKEAVTLFAAKPGAPLPDLLRAIQNTG